MLCWIWLCLQHLQKQPGHSITFICAEPSQTPPIPTQLNNGNDGAPNPAASSPPLPQNKHQPPACGFLFLHHLGLAGAGKVEWGWVALLHPAEVLPCTAGADPGCADQSHRVTLLFLPALLHTQISPTQVCWSILTFTFIFMRLKVVFD